MTAVTVLHLHSLFLKGAQSLLRLGGDRQTDTYSLAFLPLMGGQTRARHSSLQQTTEGGVARQPRGGETRQGGSVTHSESHGMALAHWGLDPWAFPPCVLCTVGPGPPASDSKPESSGLRHLKIAHFFFLTDSFFFLP